MLLPAGRPVNSPFGHHSVLMLLVARTMAVDMTTCHQSRCAAAGVRVGRASVRTTQPVIVVLYRLHRYFAAPSISAQFSHLLLSS